MKAPGRSLSKASIVILVITIIIIIVIGAYAALNFGSGGAVTSMTCAETTTTFTVFDNGTSQELNYLVPAEPCQHSISLSGFALGAAGNSPGSLTGNVIVNSYSPLTMFLVYVNGTYELFNDFYNSGETHYTIQYNAVLNNSTLPIISGINYSVEFVAVFKDGTVATSTTTLIAGS
ncbi:MAG: hypothetical protein JRN20_12175 [Nitrososphaerota archaeon]|nr:hypothetical protein [Nitrososphaerota archaeon]MDG6921785.1 hypothetical protein [Nitrososphaerota archaeon]